MHPTTKTLTTEWTKLWKHNYLKLNKSSALLFDILRQLIGVIIYIIIHFILSILKDTNRLLGECYYTVIVTRSSLPNRQGSAEIPNLFASASHWHQLHLPHWYKCTQSDHWIDISREPQVGNPWPIVPVFVKLNAYDFNLRLQVWKNV